MEPKRKRRGRSITQQDLVLITLYRLQKREKTKVKESALHQALYTLRDLAYPRLRFVTKPTLYISQLESNLRFLEKNYYISEIMVIHNESLPKYYYELTRHGEVVAEELLETLQIRNPDMMKAIMSELI